MGDDTRATRFDSKPTTVPRQRRQKCLLVFLSDAANYPQAHGSTVVALHPVVFRVSRFHRERRCFET